MTPVFVPVTGKPPLADVLDAVVVAGTAAVVVVVLPLVAAVVGALVVALLCDADAGTDGAGDVEADAGGVG